MTVTVRRPIAAAWLLSLAAHVMASPPPAPALQPWGDGAPVTMPAARQFDLVRASDGRRYRILVSEPVSPPPDGGYPVLYVLDGNAAFATVADAVRLRAQTGRQRLDAAVVVGIGYPIDGVLDEHARWYDLTPTTAELPAAYARLPDGSPTPTGGGDALLDFIEQTVRPAVAQRHTVNAQRQALLGHSLGGLLVMHALTTRPDAYQWYVAGSPALWWDQGKVLSQPEAFARRAAAVKTPVSVLIGTGEHDMVAHARRAEQWLALYAPQFSTQLRIFDGEDHLSVTPALVSRALTLFLTPANGPAAQRPAAQAAVTPHTLARTAVHTLRSDRTGQPYRIHIAWPEQPAPAQGYPVTYVLDGDSHFPVVAAAARREAEWSDGTGVAPGVVVGIGYPGASRREWDYTPPGVPVPDGANRALYPPMPQGGAADMLAFIEDQLKPWVATQHPIDTRRQSLMGHSYGGLFTLYTLLTQPDAFQGYVASSPSVWWHDRWILQRAEAIRKAGGLSGSACVSLSVGEQEQSPRAPVGSPATEQQVARARQMAQLRRMRDNAQALYTVLSGMPGLTAVTFGVQPNAHHSSAVYPAFTGALPIALPLKPVADGGCAALPSVSSGQR